MLKLINGFYDFKEAAKSNQVIVDKTMFIKEVIEGADKVTAIHRPRRFGKTLMLSTLYYFL